MRKNKLVLTTMSTVLAAGFLAGCGVNNDNDRGGDYRPLRYNDTNMYDNNLRNVPDRDVDPTLYRGTNRGMDNDRTNRGMFNDRTNRGMFNDNRGDDDDRRGGGVMGGRGNMTNR
ncbi:hypothetical protein SM124_18800 [Bacillus sp. 31A1R]|uniref:Lipoprotein n=1 Tax=Robertmurraya mangrovi TaxID=3098077 RepID=A0ABU5J332_9BACI|nr:hypothetical protein [Bacillus sp. 31A1R]MDZ5473771.1 hypothetical protein [Bacillus sp. 31A1R]